jgi:N-acetylmuramoyl-L-alanine amidase
MRHTLVRRIQRILRAISFAALLGIFAIVARIFGYAPEWPAALIPQGAAAPRIALISGHAGFDSGAVCTAADGTVTLTEAETVARITDLAAQRMRRTGAEVLLLDEYDPRLDGLQADILLSLHADSCILASGYKAAYYERSQIPSIGDRILGCIDRHYAAATGLAHDPDTVTVDMTAYHAFRKIDQHTPAAILELGFLGGDQELLTQRPEVAARGVAASVLCFLEEEPAGESPQTTEGQ